MPEKKHATMALALALAGLIAYAARVFDLFALRFADDDQTVFWYAAREFLHLHVREPCFYGQSYNTLLAGIPAAVLVGLGVKEWVAVPAVALAAGLTPWLLLAQLAWRAGKHLCAAALIAAPLLLPPAYFMILCLASFNEGLLLVAVGHWLGAGSGSMNRFAAALLLVLGVAINPNSLVLAGPVALLLAQGWWRKKGPVVPAVAGALIGVGFKLVSVAFYASHPSYNLHPNWKTEFAWPKFVDGLGHLQRHWGDLSAFSTWPWLNAALITVSALWLLRSRRWLPAAALFGSLALLFGSLGITKVHDGSESVYFSYSRMYLGLPLLTALALVLSAERLTVSRSIRTAATVGLFAIFGIGGLYRQVTMKVNVEQTLARPPTVITPFAIDRLLADCRQLNHLAQSEGVTWIFEAKNSYIAYGCSALSYGQRSFLFPSYERRTWLLEEAGHDSVTRVMVTESPADLCAHAAGSLVCKEVNHGFGAILVSTKTPEPAIDLARRAGLIVRHF